METVPVPVPVHVTPAETSRPVARIPIARLQDLWITTDPSGARIVLDEDPSLSCSAPCQLRAAQGTHRLAASLGGYLTEIREIHVEDKPVEVPLIKLTQPTGTLMLTSNPSGARIRINGALIEAITPAQLSLKPGAYSVTVEKDGMSRTEPLRIGDGIVNLRIPLSH